jgi:hypothetical protein
MNITQRDYAYMTRGAGFHGELQNIDVSRYENIGHINIDKMPRLHAMVVNKVVAVSRLGAGEIRTAAPAGAAQEISTAAKPATGQENAVARKSEPITGASTTVETGLSTNVQPASHIKSTASESPASGASSPANNGLSPAIPSASAPTALRESKSSVSRKPQGSAVDVSPGSAPTATRGALEYQQLR